MDTSDTPEEERAHLLFVDDDEQLQTLYKGLCRRWKFDCTQVYDPVKAVEMAAESQPDLIILDLNMPVMDGFQVLKALKEDARVQEIPVIMLTGGGDEVPLKVEGLSLGAMDYLTKPIDPKELLARIKNYLKVQSDAQKLAEERGIQAVKQTAVFLNHSINNLLATIQVAMEMCEEEDVSEDEAVRNEIIGENVKAISEIVQRLKKIKKVMVTTYVEDETMLDFEQSVPDDGKKTGEASES